MNLIKRILNFFSFKKKEDVKYKWELKHIDDFWYMEENIKPALDPEPLRKLLNGGDKEEYIKSISCNDREKIYKYMGLSEGLIKRLMKLNK